MIGFVHVFLIEDNLSQLVTQCLSANLSLVEFLRVQFLDLCFFNYILMIFINVHPILISIFMLTIPIYFVLIKAFRF